MKTASMSAEIRHFGKPLFVFQTETKDVWGWDRTGKSIYTQLLWRMREGQAFCHAHILKFGSETLFMREVDRKSWPNG